MAASASPKSARTRWYRPRTLGRIAIGAGCLLVLLALLGVGYELILPSVGTAQLKVLQIDRSHQSQVGALAVPTRLGEAVVAVEDEHFYAGPLVNVLDGLGRAGLATLHGSGDPGGSTIDQQLAKQLYGQGAGLTASIRELALGLKLAVSYPANRILAMYLAAVYYGNHYWGDSAAAQGYFGLQPGQLSWAQAALLAGLPQAPSAYDPIHHYLAAKQRQLHVLDQLVANHDLTRAQARAAYRAPLGLRPGSS
ncbi:MAG TPA: biosynthetic peptidoglycan transglycosylase [Candidatus Dormibacteraeota bacterium]|nr:biosynthetic peptidoglycan transglycosylase [Candidatus Dormibacteraeota bacterium]